VDDTRLNKTKRSDPISSSTDVLISWRARVSVDERIKPMQATMNSAGL
jgi:hypothetical protein